MKILIYSTLALAVVTTLLCSPARLAQAGGEEFGKEVTRQQYTGRLGTGKFEAIPFHVSVSVRGGYDDNVNLSSFDERGSPFSSVQLGLTYNFGSPRTAISLSAGAGVTYYFDRGDEDFDDDSMAATTRMTSTATRYMPLPSLARPRPRLTLGCELYATYQSRTRLSDFQL